MLTRDNFVVSEETEDMVGIEIVEDGDSVIIRDIDTLEGTEAEYYVPKSDIPKLIEGLKLFMEVE
ncbi:MAG: hypothetical protein M0R80_03865 [Proteobacteria bacterium]|nr:hypothetical protein [Pseudomonadota bacterium]